MCSVASILLRLMLVCLASLATAAPVWNTIDQTPLHDASSLSDSIRAALEKAEVIPDVLDAFLPTFSVSVYYPKTQSHVKLGNTLLPSAVSSSPNVLIHQLSSSEKLTSTPTIRANVTYTLALTDPDATSHADPVKGEMCHWIVTGMSLPKSSSDQTVLIPSSHVGFRNIDLNNQDISISNVTELISYLPPSPPPKTGFHRYVFVMLASAASDDRHIEQGLKKPKERPHWGYGKVGKGVRHWAKENGLVVVGANFFYAENEQQ